MIDLKHWEIEQITPGCEGNIPDLLDDSPSLRRQMPDLIALDCDRIREETTAEAGLPLATFPETCPWTAEQVLDEDFLPE